MGRLFVFLVIAALFQFVLVWALTHLGLAVLGVAAWWMWSRRNGGHRA